MIISCSFPFRMRNVLKSSYGENQNIHFIFNNFFSRKSCRSWDNVETYFRIAQITDDKITRRRSMDNVETYFRITQITDDKITRRRSMDNVETYFRIAQITDDKITRCRSIACWITKVTDTHSEYATLTTFPLQQWLHEAPPC
jgi:hypothetical protein